MPNRKNSCRKKDIKIEKFLGVLTEERERVVQYLLLECSKEMDQGIVKNLLRSKLPKIFGDSGDVIKRFGSGIEEFQFQIEQCRFAIEILKEGRYAEIKQILSYIGKATYEMELPNNYKQRSTVFSLKEFRFRGIQEVIEYCSH